jgi:hypothetical protein
MWDSTDGRNIFSYGISVGRHNERDHLEDRDGDGDDNIKMDNKYINFRDAHKKLILSRLFEHIPTN